jgi:hypothetical protein
MKSVPLRGSVGSMSTPEAMSGKAQAIRYHTDFHPTLLMRTIDPALPRIGTDFMTLRVAMRNVYPCKPLA